MQNLSGLTVARFVSLEIAPIRRPFYRFWDRLDNHFVVFGVWSEVGFVPGCGFFFKPMCFCWNFEKLTALFPNNTIENT